MSEYISDDYVKRSDVHKAFQPKYAPAINKTFAAIIDSIPAADVAPVRHGTWIKADEQPYFRKHYHAKVCSECGKRKDGKWLYCPYCGSKNQDGGQDE